jgi:hypothetical protein
MDATWDASGAELADAIKKLEEEGRGIEKERGAGGLVKSKWIAPTDWLVISKSINGGDVVGMEVTPLKIDKGVGKGGVVGTIDRNSRAYVAGDFKPKDILLSIDGKVLSSVDHTTIEQMLKGEGVLEMVIARDMSLDW